MRPSQETKRFWLMMYAMDAFQNVISSCQYLLENDFHVAGPMYRRIVTSIVTMYGRPFHNNYGVGKLEAGLVPTEYKQLHDQIIHERDKTHAHTDASGLNTRVGNANQVRLLRVKDGFKWVTCTYLPYDHGDLRNICRLCEVLVEKLNDETDKYEKRCIEVIKALPEGEYILSLDEKADNIFIKVPSVLPPPDNIELTPIE